MVNYLNNILLFFLLAIVAISCAVEAAPMGGPADVTGPSTIEEESTENYQTNFDSREIELTFDEWVVLKNPTQIVVSPPLEFSLQVELKKKTLRISFDEEETLQEDVTYTVNMGEAIVDLTEGNPMDNYSFVFSTGDVLDSLQVSGIVFDDLTGEPVEDVYVTLYENLNDTMFLTTRPFYFATTNSNGSFTLKNLRSDTFRVFSLQDKNANYYFDQSSESYGFLEEPIILTDSFSRKLQIPFYLPEGVLDLYSQINRTYGKIILIFNKKPEQVNYQWIGTEPIHITKTEKDSFLLYYNNDAADVAMVVDVNGEKDTIELKIKPEEFISPSIKLSSTSGNNKISPKDSIELTMNQPVFELNSDFTSITDTSGKKIEFSMKRKAKNPYKILISSSSFKENKIYELQMLPSSLTGVHGQTNDTISYRFQTLAKENFGSLIVVLDSLDTEKEYIVRLMGQKFEQNLYIKNESSFKKTIDGLRPGDYKIRVIEDLNGNRRWDTGNYEQKRQSERWFEKELDPLKADWTLEIKMNANEFKANNFTG